MRLEGGKEEAQDDASRVMGVQSDVRIAPVNVAHGSCPHDWATVADPPRLGCSERELAHCGILRMFVNSREREIP